MNWNDKKQVIEFQWLEERNGTTESHYLNKKPVSVTLHPLRAHIVRAYFKGHRPAWIERFSKNYGYATGESGSGSMKGWWITRFEKITSYQNMIVPSVRGMINEWFGKLPKACEDDQKRLLEEIDTVKTNLFYFRDELEEFGIHFSPEIIKKEYGYTVLNNELFPKEVDGEPFNLKDWPEYKEAVKQLLVQREVSLEQLEGSLSITDDEETIDLDELLLVDEEMEPVIEPAKVAIIETELEFGEEEIIDLSFLEEVTIDELLNPNEIEEDIELDDLLGTTETEVEITEVDVVAEQGKIEPQKMETSETVVPLVEEELELEMIEETETTVLEDPLLSSKVESEPLIQKKQILIVDTKPKRTKKRKTKEVFAEGQALLF